MSKWGDYLISRVRYTKDHKRIEYVETYTDDGETVKLYGDMKRETVVANLKKGLKFTTIRKKDGKWNKGDNVITYESDGEHFIRTDGNKVKEDNLGELEEY